MMYSKEYPIQLQWGVRIPLRDGVRLQGTLYRPPGLTQSAPCVLTMTPYVADRYHKRAMYFASRGLPFLIVDVRGRGNSEGEFRPYIQEGQDGFDVVEWLARQPYCNGQVAMWGGSYGGYAQWATAAQRPPHLCTIVPTAAPHIGLDFPMRNNIAYPYSLQWLALTSGRAAQDQLFADNTFWSQCFLRWHRSGRGFRDLDDVLGLHSAVFQEWVSHPQIDGFWDSFNPSVQQYAQLDLPILTVTGSYDDDQPGALEHYRRHLAATSGRARHFLVIGPWDHQATTTPRDNIGGVPVGSASLIDLPQLHCDWYAWTFQGGPQPAFLKKPVTYYVTGLEQWRAADSLDDITSRHECLYLDSAGEAHDVHASGSLRLAPGVGRPDSYIYDPADLSGPELQAQATADPTSLVDQSLHLALRGKALFYHSEPFTEAVDVAGFFRLVLWISLDCPDTDLYVSIHEIDTEGRSIRLSTDAIRARYRNGLRQAELITTNEPLCYEFSRFTFNARRLSKGHRLRLVIAPLGYLVDTNFAQRNGNDGAVVAESSLSEGRPVTVTAFHDQQYPSCLYVPIAKSETGSGEQRRQDRCV